MACAESRKEGNGAIASESERQGIPSRLTLASEPASICEEGVWTPGQMAFNFLGAEQLRAGANQSLYAVDMSSEHSGDQWRGPSVCEQHRWIFSLFLVLSESTANSGSKVNKAGLSIIVTDLRDALYVVPDLEQPLQQLIIPSFRRPMPVIAACPSPS